MTDHLSDAMMSALADGELTEEQLSVANRHLGACPHCTSSALHRCLLKSATAKAGQRYQPSPHLQERLARLSRQEDPRAQAEDFRTAPVSTMRSILGIGSRGWVAAAVFLVAIVSLMLFEHARQRDEAATAEQAALVSEVFDQHVATLAGNSTLQVVSTDRHTVKPWFQGKIPFSFNLPESLPSDTTLDGANLTYLRDQPVAQLLYSIGKHRVSVFLRQRVGAMEANDFVTERAGFHVMVFNTNNLEAVAVSDVDGTRLAELVSAIKYAQTPNR